MVWVIPMQGQLSLFDHINNKDGNEMNKDEFLNEFKKVLEIDSNQEITENIVLNDLEEYDSLAVLGIISMVDENFGKKITAVDFKNFSTINDLINFIGQDKFK